ncbi:hypothetical protein [Reichenbachiella sp.]|uniref:hypothetical protein n=1 Tax=Reichenbachiella sp. TaxID=2184521 RepID=UPI003B5C7889
MPGLQKINFQGKEIIYLDYRGQSEQQMIGYLKEAEQTILDENKPYLTLTNISDAFATKKFLQQAGRLGEKTEHLTVKGAIVGLNGGKKVLLKVFNRLFAGKKGLQPFDTEKEALEYLVR